MARVHSILREQARLRQQAEAISSAATTIGRGDGGTEDASGSSPNRPVRSQSPTDAGQSHANPTVQADRDPGELPDGVRSIHGRAGGRFTAHTTESTMATPSTAPISEAGKNDRIGQKTTVGLFAGTFVRVIDKATNEMVDRGIIRYVHKDKIELKGGDEYDQEHYTFVRIA